jgi:hypothetical protein
VLAALQFGQQVGADVARADDCGRYVADGAALFLFRFKLYAV